MLAAKQAGEHGPLFAPRGAAAQEPVEMMANLLGQYAPELRGLARQLPVQQHRAAAFARVDPRARPAAAPRRPPAAEPAKAHPRPPAAPPAPGPPGRPPWPRTPPLSGRAAHRGRAWPGSSTRARAPPLPRAGLGGRDLRQPRRRAPWMPARPGPGPDPRARPLPPAPARTTPRVPARAHRRPPLDPPRARPSSTARPSPAPLGALRPRMPKCPSNSRQSRVSRGWPPTS